MTFILVSSCRSIPSSDPGPNTHTGACTHVTSVIMKIDQLGVGGLVQREHGDEASQSVGKKKKTKSKSIRRDFIADQKTNKVEVEEDLRRKNEHISSNGNSLSFSYLNLLNAVDGSSWSFPQRTQPIITNKSGHYSGRRNSLGSAFSSSLEYLHQTKKSDLRARSNPIGLAEPENKRDGLGVLNKDGSLYGSSEHLFSYTTVVERRASTSSIGFRAGSGLIATGKPANNHMFCMPFGETSTASRGSSNSSSSSSSKKVTTSNGGTSAVGDVTKAFIRKGIAEMESLTKAASSIETSSASSLSNYSSASSEEAPVSQQRESSGTSNNVGTFQAVDVLLESTLLQHQVEFTVPRRGRNRRRSSTTLPEQSVTISLPASRAQSRDASAERARRSGSVVEEVFSGTFQMRLPRSRGKKANVEEAKKVASSFYAYSAGCVDKNNEDGHDSCAAAAAAAPTESITKKDDLRAMENLSTVTHAAKTVQQSKSGESAERRREQATRPQPEHTAIKSQGRDDKIKIQANSHGVGEALKSLTAALENLQHEQQKQQKTKHLSVKPCSTSQSTSLTVSLRSSRSVTPERSGGLRSRKNSMDLYTAEVDVVAGGKRRRSSSRTRSTCHIRCDDNTVGDLHLCQRCHSHEHPTDDCKTFASLRCPRCLRWDHWEDSCSFIKSGANPCAKCQKRGHGQDVHDANDFAQRRVIVDTLGWESFAEWFYDDGAFRSWWQLNGCVGVPLYRLYRRKAQWRTEVAPLSQDELNNNDIYNYMTRSSRILNDNDSVLAKTITPPEKPPRRNYTLERDDSIDELMKTIAKPRKRVEEREVEGMESDRSTPEHLKKYSGTMDDDDEDGDGDDDDDKENNIKERRRTFSDTLKLLDADILAELDVN